jgi:electron transport complex protein RnfG
MIRAKEKKNVVAAGWLLALTALLGTGLMTAVYWHSKPYIAENDRAVLLQSLNSVLPAANYDNDILADTRTVVNRKMLGSKEPVTVYRARKDGKPVAAILTVTAPQGYSGPIVLLVGIGLDGKITGVRAVKHQETPGLGDQIEIRKSRWVNEFKGKSRDNPTDAGWKVKKDGGRFDQFTGATITPRAVVAAVHKALIYFTRHRELIFARQDTTEE